MPVLRRPGSILQRSGMFGFSHPDPSYGFRGTAFRSYNPRSALVPPSGAQGEAEQPLPSPLPPPAVPSPGGMNGAPMPTFANPNVAFNRANDANAEVAYLKALPQSADPIVNALRAKSIASRSGIANNFTGNAYLGRELATDANRRSNDLNAATMRGMDAYSGTMLPSLAREADSRATLNTGENERANTLLPSIQGEMDARTAGMRIQNQGNESLLKFLPQQAKQDVRTSQIRNNRDEKMLPAYVRNAEIMGAAPLPTKAPNPRDVATLNRMLLEQGRDDDARRLVDAMLPSLVPPTRPNTARMIPYSNSGSIEQGGQSFLGPAETATLLPMPAPTTMPTTRPVAPAQPQGKPVRLRNGQVVHQTENGFIDQQGNQFDLNGKFIGR